MLQFLKNWTLPVAMLAGVLCYFFFANVSLVAPLKPFILVSVDVLTPLLIFAQLLLTFCKIDLRDLMPVKWHLWLLLFLLFWKGGVAAPVEWSVSTEDRNDGTIRVLFTARIEAPWHIYDLGPYDDMGPNATTVVFEPNESVTLVGGIESLTRPVRVYDSLFALEIA